MGDSLWVSKQSKWPRSTQWTLLAVVAMSGIFFCLLVNVYVVNIIMLCLTTVLIFFHNQSSQNVHRVWCRLVNAFGVKAGVVRLQCERCVIHTWALQRWVPYHGALYKCPSFLLLSTVYVDMWTDSVDRHGTNWSVERWGRELCPSCVTPGATSSALQQRRRSRCLGNNTHQ